jgi:hypothetical protein
VPTSPTQDPTAGPTLAPTETPTCAPSGPSYAPTPAPSATPTFTVTPAPTRKPTVRPTRFPSAAPSNTPTKRPSAYPTAPTLRPTVTPTVAPTLPAQGIAFDSVLTFQNLSTPLLTADDQRAVVMAAATSMQLDQSYIKVTSQTSEQLSLAGTNAHVEEQRHMGIQSSAERYLMTTVLTTTVPLSDGVPPMYYYTLLVSKLDNAVNGPAFLYYLQLAEDTIGTESTFVNTTAEDCGVINNFVEILGQPTAMPTTRPTKAPPHRLDNGPLAGTVLAAVAGCGLIATALYFAIVNFRKRERKETEKAKDAVIAEKLALATRTKEEPKPAQVELPWQLDYGRPAQLQGVRRHELRSEVAASAHQSPRAGVVQIILETDSLI